MNKNDIPLVGGELIGNLAARLVEESISSVEALEASEFSENGVAYKTFVDWVVKQDDINIMSTSKINIWDFDG